MYCETTTVVGGCGVGIMYTFMRDKIKWSNMIDLKTYDFEKNCIGGCGFQIACFVDTQECRETYKEIKERFPLVYQSPIRHNVNSDNNFFFVVFDTGQPTLGDEDEEPSGFPNGLEW